MELTLQRGAIPVDLDRKRILFFDHAATWMLIQKYGPRFLLDLFRTTPNKNFELVSMDALAFFLWAGLQADAKFHGEELTPEQAAAFLRPWNYSQVFLAVVFAAVGANALPSQPGKAKADGAAAEPAAATKAAPKNPGPTRVTTSMKRSASPTPSSGGRRGGSGARQRAS